MARNTSQPIGIFDSGIGGLTVANAIYNLMPNERLVYFGDTAHFPYGEKSQDLIQHYAIKISDYLIQHHNCKAIVIACNTASAAAYNQLKAHYLRIIPIINVIDPMVEHIISSSYQKVGIIATRGTVDSGVYQEKIRRRKPSQAFSALATPLLASMIEENFISNSISKSILKEYLSNDTLNGIDALVLACTHYPLIESEIAAYYQQKVQILNSAKIVAEKLKLILDKEQLSHLLPQNAPHTFMVSCLTPNFQKSTKLFFGKEIKLVEVAPEHYLSDRIK